MKKYIFSLVILVGLVVGLFSVNNISYAKTNLTSDEVQAVIEILEVLKINDTDISRIKNILDESKIQEVKYSPNTGKEIIPVKVEVKETTGCENNYKYNIKTGQFCPNYKAPRNSNKGNGSGGGWMSASA